MWIRKRKLWTDEARTKGARDTACSNDADGTHCACNEVDVGGREDARRGRGVVDVIEVVDGAEEVVDEEVVDAHDITYGNVANGIRCTNNDEK